MVGVAVGVLRLEAVFFETPAHFRAWLETNHATAAELLVGYYKKGTERPSMTWPESVDQALCFGWIDGVARKLDEERSMLYFAPRKADSGWSRPNKTRIERLMADGRMAPAGLAKIEAAKANGSWTLLDSVDRLEVPADLAAEFDQYPAARANFDTFPRSARHAILGWIVQAKRPETRAKRVAETARLAQENVRANQWRP